MKKRVLNKMDVAHSPGIYWGGGYNNEYAKYEQGFPFAYPYTNKTENDAPRYVMGDDGYWYNPNAKETGRAVLCCTGDLMCEPKQHAAYKFGNQYFFHPQFKFVRDILKGADFSVGNLETTLTDSTPYAGTWHRIEGKYHCNAPKSYLDAIRYAGFDALVNANNHNCDSAVEGLIDTLDAMDEAGFMHTGTFHPYGDPRYILVKINGIRVAVLSYATYYNKLDANFTELGRELLLNAYHPDKVRGDVEAARADGAEFVIVYIHWGNEYTHEISGKQQERAAEIAEAGADYIVGSHSHNLQPYDQITTQDGRLVPVIYSMGNFVTNESRSICKHTAILQLVLKKRADSITVDETLIPCYIYDEIRSSAYAPVPVDVTLNQGLANDTLNKAQEYIQKVMEPMPMPVTSAIDIEGICTALSIQRPNSIKNRYVTRLCTHPNNIVPGSVFFGIIWNSKSELQDARKKGALAVITNRPVEGLPCLVVSDVNQAYCDVYSALRSRFAVKTALITGSVGKTTTKEILEHVIGENYIMHSSPGNWNTRHTGMLVMQKLREYHEFYVQEVHEGDPNSARMMSLALQPNYCVITNIDSPHRENFTSDEEFFRCFTDISAGLKSDGILFVNGDDKLLMDGVRALGEVPYRVVTFGLKSESLDYRAENICIKDGQLELEVVYGDHCIRTHLKSPVEENAYNVLAAFAVGAEDGLAPDSISEAISKYESDGIRQNVMNFNGLKVMLDCRSAAPISVIAAIRAFCELEPDKHGHRVALIGDMHLSEEESKREHAKIGQFIATQSNIDYLLCYGEESQHVLKAAVKHGFPKEHAMHFEKKRTMEKIMCELLKPGDTLLIKGGRRMYLNSTIRRLFGYTVSID